MIKRLLSAIALSCLITVAQPGFLKAQNTAGITISPFLQEITVGIGEPTKDLSITLTNHTDKTRDFTVKAVDFGSLDETGGVAFSGVDGQTLDKKYGLADWLELKRTSITLAPNQTDTVRATILNRTDLKPGGHYAAILLSASGNGGAGQVQINQTLSSLLFLLKTGGEQYGVQLQKVELGNRWLHLPASIVLPITNTGNVHTRPRGIVSVVNPFGKEVSRGIINQESGYVLPEATRRYVVDLRVMSRQLFPGKYHLKIKYRYNSSAVFQTDDVAFWYIGWPTIFALSLLAGLFILLLKRFRKSLIQTFKNVVKKISKKPAKKPVDK